MGNRLRACSTYPRTAVSAVSSDLQQSSHITTRRKLSTFQKHPPRPNSVIPLNHNSSVRYIKPRVLQKPQQKPMAFMYDTKTRRFIQCQVMSQDYDIEVVRISDLRWHQSTTTLSQWKIEVTPPPNEQEISHLPPREGQDERFLAYHVFEPCITRNPEIVITPPTKKRSLSDILSRLLPSLKKKSNKCL